PLGRNADTQLLVFDSSWVGLAPIPPADLMYRNYKAQYEAAFALGARARGNVFLAHHPVLGFASNPSNPQQPFPGNRGLQSVLEPMYPGALFPANVDLVLSGHNHLFEIVTFSTPHAPQFITGNGGTARDDPFPVPFPPSAQPAPGAVVAEIVSSTGFGFMTMDRDAAGWIARAWDYDGKLMTTCTLAGRRIACTSIADRAGKP
ncbi:MAG: metallophosphoesterase, partial [Burkholderiales bacterium]|nr:metallophosphoesterase [Burkholderiales bacterium]